MTKETFPAVGEAPVLDWVSANAGRIRPGGRVLDLACGRGRHARWLAGQGFEVVAVDRDPLALEALRGIVGLRCLCADLETGTWPLPGEHFDGIVVTNYLHRPLLVTIAESLVPGGVVIYETFMRGNERFGSPRNPAFLLESGELRRWAEAARLEVLAFAEIETGMPQASVRQRLLARRPTGNA